MDNSLVKVSNNWTQIGGCTTSQAIQVHSADPDVFIRPPIDELVNENKSILLNRSESTDFCELYLEIYPHYKIQAVSFVSNVAKVEIFQGPLKEYLETIYGTVIDESEDEFNTYRYDIEVEKSGITHLTLRFLTDSNEVCIFGIMLYTAPNPNGITTLLPNFNRINMQNVQNILQNSSKQPGPNFEKSKQLLELMSRTNESNNTLQLEAIMKQKLNFDDKELDQNLAKNTDTYISNQIKSYIDERFTNMEQRINSRLEDMEKRQMQKLDSILKILQTIVK